MDIFDLDVDDDGGGISMCDETRASRHKQYYPLSFNFLTEEYIRVLSRSMQRVNFS